jgi:hypothetical protein
MYGYHKTGDAPRAVLLALFWESSWGRSTADCEAFNARKVLQSLSDSLKNENAMLRARIARLEELGDFGSANEPVLGPLLANPRLHAG